MIFDTKKNKQIGLLFQKILIHTMMDIKKTGSIIALLASLIPIYKGIVFIVDQRNEVAILKAENANLKIRYDDLHERFLRLYNSVVANVTDGSVSLEKLRPFLTPKEVWQVSAATGKPPQFPVALDSMFYPSGWMGDGESGNKYIGYQAHPERINGQQTTVIEINCRRGPKGFAGLYWQYPDGNWGQKPGRNLTGARSITFLARGGRDSQIVELKSGGISGQYQDSYQLSLGKVVLNRQWKKYRIDLSKADLSNVIGAFALIVAASDNGNRDVTTTYIANLQVE